MKNMNLIKITGRLHSHELKVAAKKDGEVVLDKMGNTGITGKVTVEVDANGNTVQIDYFAFPFYPGKNGAKPKANATYHMLKKMMDGELGTIATNDATNPPVWLSYQANFDMNYFVSKGEVQRSLKVKGSFINEIPKGDEPKYDNSFVVHMIITSRKDIEPDEEKGYEGYTMIGGYMADFRDQLSDVSFRLAPAALAKCPVNEDTVEPYWTAVGGSVIFQKRLVETVDDFGDAVKREFNNRMWVVEKFGKEPFDLYDEDLLGKGAFEVKIAELKERIDALTSAPEGKDDGKLSEDDF